MFLKVLKIFLSPVLIHQGRRVARKTPRLPEARGPRKGTQGNGRRQIRLLILGDSAAAGVGAGHQDQALAGQLLGCFGPQYTVNWELIAKTGATTAGTVKHIKSLPPATFDFVVTSLGVNDVKNGIPVEKWTDQQKRLITLMRNRFKVRRFIISAVPPMEMFPALPWPLNRYLGLYAALMNQAVKKWLKTQTDCEFVEFSLPMDPSLMAEDGFHPAPRLHSVWAKEIFNRIEKQSK